MVGTILPIVYGERDSRWPRSAACLYCASGAASGAVVGVVCGTAGAALMAVGGHYLLPVTQMGTLGLLMALIAAIDFNGWSGRLPQSRWQVPSRWRSHYSPMLATTLYGAILGPGVAVRIATAMYYGLMWIIVIAGSPALGAVLLGAYGASRGIPVLVLSLCCRSSDDAMRWVTVLEWWHPAFQTCIGVLAATICGWCLYEGRL